MKVLFVSSGGKNYQISPIVENQAESLKNKEINLSYFLIEGQGILNYFKAIFRLRKALKNTQPDIIHAHYGLCGIVSFLASRNE
jgi:teichuronic acid biosynthesis glycosyltransferase TuaC